MERLLVMLWALTTLHVVLTQSHHGGSAETMQLLAT